MKIFIKRVRISFFWSTRFAALLEDAPPAGAPLAALGHANTYAPVFAGLLAKPQARAQPAAGAPELELPWPAKGTHWFWSRYLNANPIRSLSGTFAFVRLVPLRRRPSPAPGLGLTLPDELVAASKLKVESVVTEAWFHPHMVTFALHVNATGEMTPEALASVCVAVRRDRVFVGADKSKANFKLDEIASTHVAALRDEAIGATESPLPPLNPFSLVTVLQGEHEGAAIAQGDDLHKALEMIVRWQPGGVGTLEAGTVSSREALDLQGPLLFARSRARAVWDPPRFALNHGSSLTCYHRNLFVGTMQAEALLSFAGIAGELASQGQRPKAVRDAEDAVLKRLVDLHAGREDSTYRSASLRRFIDDHPQRAAVNEMAQRIRASARLP